jgi:hypothetical protein
MMDHSSSILNNAVSENTHGSFQFHPKKNAVSEIKLTASA